MPNPNPSAAGSHTGVRVTPVMPTSAVASDHKLLAPSNKRKATGSR